jgi:hypothetical protein
MLIINADDFGRVAVETDATFLREYLAVAGLAAPNLDNGSPATVQ